MAARPWKSEVYWLAGSCAVPEVEGLGVFLSSDKHQVLIPGRSRSYSGAAFRVECPVMEAVVRGEGSKNANAKTKTSSRQGPSP